MSPLNSLFSLGIEYSLFTRILAKPRPAACLHERVLFQAWYDEGETAGPIIMVVQDVPCSTQNRSKQQQLGTH